MANKWTFERPVDMTKNKNLQKIIQFYVWETPVPEVSQKGIPFKKYGWERGSFNTLHAHMRNSSSLKKGN